MKFLSQQTGSEILDFLNQMIFILDEEDRVVWANKTAETFFSDVIIDADFHKLFKTDNHSFTKNRNNVVSSITDKSGRNITLSHSVKKLKKKGGITQKCVRTEDITEKIRDEEKLKNLLEFKNLLTRLALESINIPVDQINTHLEKILSSIGQFADIDRCFIILLHKESGELRISQDWCSPDFKSTRNTVKIENIPSSWLKRKKSEIIIVPDILKVKSDNAGFPGKVFSKGMKSAMMVPLILNDKFIGYLGFSAAKKNPELSTEIKSIFQIAAEITVNLYERKEKVSLIEMNRRILSKSSGMIAYIDNDGIIRACSATFKKFHSLCDNQVSPIPFMELFNDQNINKNLFEHAIDKCFNGEERKIEIWYRRTDSIRLLEVSLHPELDPENKIAGIIYSADDITERMQLEAKILEVMHEERKKIGISLHDDLGHDLLAVEIKARIISDSLKDISSELSVEVREIEASVKLALNEVRRLSHGIIPYKNSGLEFTEMIDATALNIERNYNIKCEFNIENSLTIFDESIIKELYYIIDEAVANSAKHSECTLISVSIFTENDMAVLKILDNGKGIPKTSGKNPGAGFEIMKYRARSIGGTLAVEENPRGGTIVKCVFSPVKIKL